MSNVASPASGTVWTGDLALDLRNGRDWSVGDADVSVHRDSVIVRHQGRTLAVLDRELFRDWLTMAEPEPLAVDDLVWWVQAGITLVNVGQATFRVTPESLSPLVSVI